MRGRRVYSRPRSPHIAGMQLKRCSHKQPMGATVDPRNCYFKSTSLHRLDRRIHIRMKCKALKSLRGKSVQRNARNPFIRKTWMWTGKKTDRTSAEATNAPTIITTHSQQNEYLCKHYYKHAFDASGRAENARTQIVNKTYHLGIYELTSDWCFEFEGTCNTVGQLFNSDGDLRWHSSTVQITLSECSGHLAENEPMLWCVRSTRILYHGMVHKM